MDYVMVQCWVISRTVKKVIVIMVAEKSRGQHGDRYVGEFKDLLKLHGLKNFHI